MSDYGGSRNLLHVHRNLHKRLASLHIPHPLFRMCVIPNNITFSSSSKIEILV